MSNKGIDIAFCLQERDSNSKYPMALVALYRSIRAHTRASLRLHIIVDDSVTTISRNKIACSLINGDCIRWVEASSCQDAYSLGKEVACDFSAAMIWRAWLPEYLEGLEECLSLDCDLIMLFDIERLYTVNLSGYYVAAPLRKTPWGKEYHKIIETPPERYFRNGVCRLNLGLIRSHYEYRDNRYSFLKQCRERESRIQPVVLWEQSLFNRYFSTAMQPIGLHLIPVERIGSHPRKSEWEFVLEKKEDVVLDFKGWHNLTEYSRFFWEYLRETPWDEEARANLDLHWSLRG